MLTSLSSHGHEVATVLEMSHFVMASPSCPVFVDIEHGPCQVGRDRRREDPSLKKSAFLFPF